MNTTFKNNNNSSIISCNSNSKVNRITNNEYKDHLMVKEINKLSTCIKSVYKKIKKEIHICKSNNSNTNDNEISIHNTIANIEKYLNEFATEAKIIFQQLKHNRKALSNSDAFLLHRQKHNSLDKTDMNYNKNSLLKTYSVLSPSDTNSKALSSLTNSPLMKTWTNEKESFISHKGNPLNNSESYIYSKHKRSNSSNMELNNLLGTIKHMCKNSSMNNGIKSRNYEWSINKRKVILGLLENVANVVNKEKSYRNRTYSVSNSSSFRCNKHLNDNTNKDNKMNEYNVKEVELLKKELNSKNDVIYKLKQELNKGAVKKLKEKIQRIEKEICVKNERIKDLEIIEKMYNMNRNSKLRKRNSNSLNVSTTVNNNSNSSGDNINKLKQKISELQQQLTSKNNIINTLNTNNIYEQLSQCKTEIQSQHTFIEQLKQHHESQLTTMKFHLNAKANEIQSLLTENASLTENISSLSQQITDLKSQSKSAIYNQEQTDLIRNVEILKKENEKFVKENAKLKNDVMVKTNSYLMLQSKYNKEKSLLEKEVKEKTNKLNDMMITLKYKSEMLVNQVMLVEKGENDKKEVDNMNEMLNEKVKVKEETIELLSENNKELLKEREKLMKQLKRYQKEK